MISKINWSKGLPFAVAVIFYAIVSYGYFAPQIGGDVLYQHDVKQYDGMTQDILECRQATGEDPQWTGSMFSGMPAYLINVAYPAQIIKVAFSRVMNLFGTPAAFIFFAMLAMWLMLVMMGFNGWVAIVGGLMYGLSTYFFLIIEAGHITKMWALVYAPLMFGGVHMALRGSWLWGSALAALFASLEIGANHPQITYYFGMAIAVFWLSELYFASRDSRVGDFAKRTGTLAIATILAVTSNLAPLWYTLEHTPETIRGGSELVVETSTEGGLDMDYATAWSYGTVESLNMLVPSFVGGSSFDTFSNNGAVAEALAPYEMSHLTSQLPLYWGPQSFTGGPTYIGAVVIFLALLALLLMRGREKWWIVTITVIMILLAWGRHFMWFSELMFNTLPGYNKFRTVSMTLVVVEWTLPLLSIFALSKLWSGKITKEESMKALKISAGALVGLLTIFIIAGGALFSFGYDDSFKMLAGGGFPENIAKSVAEAMSQERFGVMQGDTLRSLMLIIAAAGVVWLSIIGKIKRPVMLTLIAALVALDLIPVNQRYLNEDDFTSSRQAKIHPTQIDKEILADKELGYRVLNLTVSPFNDATTSYFHRSVGGYHGAKLSRYQDLIDAYFAQGISSEVLNMLNTKYIISSDDSGTPNLIVNDEAFGAAWFVENIKSVDSAQEEIDALAEVDLKSTAVVNDKFNIEPSTTSAGEIELIEYQPNHLKYNYTSQEDGIAVFSEIYYPKGWSAYIDGEQADYFQANYVLRAMELPAGFHTVEWRFKAPRWSLIEGITLAASLLIILWFVILLAIKLYERREENKA